MSYHPHVHYVVPGGGVNRDRTQWLPSRADFFLPVRALSTIYQAKFRDAMRRAGLYEQIDPAVWRKKWVVHSQPTGDGRATLRYLAAYVFRVAIGDHRVLSCSDGRVRFSYRKSGSTRTRTMTLDASEFIRRFLEHVLPSGFQKVRHYGFASPNATLSLEAVRWLITLHAGRNVPLSALPTPPVKTTPPIHCPECGSPLLMLGFVRAGKTIPFDSS